MEAVLLAAGLGSRLRPITNNIPKALVEVCGVTLLERNIENLARQGISHIIVNVHHFADKIVDFLSSRSWPVHISISDESDCLLDTGGAIAKASTLFQTMGPYVIHNVDILSTISISEMLDSMNNAKSIATLAVSQRESGRQLIFDGGNRLVGWHSRVSDEYRWSGRPCLDAHEMAFSGVAVLAHSMVEIISNHQGAFPIIPVYLEAAKNHVINSFEHNSEEWMDIGKHAALEKAATFLKNLGLA